MYNFAKAILFIVGGLIILFLFVVFFPFKDPDYLETIEKKVSVGKYRVEARVLGSYQSNKKWMYLHARFHYPAKKLRDDGCKLTINIVGEPYKTSPDPKFYRSFENDRILSSVDIDEKYPNYIEEDQLGITLVVYDLPREPQKFNLEISPIDKTDTLSDCKAQSILKYTAKDSRSSAFQNMLYIT